MISHLYLRVLCTLLIGAIASVISLVLAIATDDKMGRNRIWGIVSIALLGFCVVGVLIASVVFVWNV